MFVELKGKRALFARHELKIEQFSYEVPTPSALMGLLKSIYWKPEMDYIIRKIHVINKPKFELIMENAQSQATNTSELEKVLFIDNRNFNITRDENATPRSRNVLVDVHYIVEFDITLTGAGTSEDDTVTKHINIFKRRVEKGQYFRQPCLGSTEFECEINLIKKEDIPVSKIHGIKELGLMLHHIDYDDTLPKAIFYKPIMRNGIIDVNETSNSDKGWFFAELCRFYDRNNQYDLPVLGYSREKITYRVVLNKEGEMIKLDPLNCDSRGKCKPVILTVPEMVKGRTSCIKANFLYDNASYIFGFDEKRGEEKQKEFVDKIKKIIQEPIDEIEILLKFFKDYKNHDYSSFFEPFTKDNGEVDIQGNIVFQIEDNDHFIHELDDVKRQWTIYYESIIPGNMGICAVTGNYEKKTDMHPIIKGVINSSAFTKLISVNKSNTAFNSYGWQGLDNSVMGVNATHKYSTSLNWLLQHIDHRVSIGNSTFIFWTENENPQLLKDIKKLLLGFDPDAGLELEKPIEITIPDNEVFFIAELKANASRLFIKGFWKFQYGTCFDDITNFCLSIEHAYKDTTLRQNWDYISHWKGEYNLNSDGISYKLGELFAILEKAQKDAVKSTRETITIADKYLEKAARTPSLIFPRLLEKSIHHINKVDYGIGEKLREKLDELEAFNNPFPSKLTNEDRCVFYMGYHKMYATLNKR